MSLLNKEEINVILCKALWIRMLLVQRNNSLGVETCVIGAILQVLKEVNSNFLSNIAIFRSGNKELTILLTYSNKTMIRGLSERVRGDINCYYFKCDLSRW